jgi:hypothetical protein
VRYSWGLELAVGGCIVEIDAEGRPQRIEWIPASESIPPEDIRALVSRATPLIIIFKNRTHFLLSRGPGANDILVGDSEIAIINKGRIRCVPFTQIIGIVYDLKSCPEEAPGTKLATQASPETGLTQT